MKRYLNKAEKQAVLSIASFQTYMDEKVEEWANKPKLERKWRESGEKVETCFKKPLEKRTKTG